MDKKPPEGDPTQILRYFDSLGVNSAEEAILRVRNDLEGAAAATGLSIPDLLATIERLSAAPADAKGTLFARQPDDLKAGDLTLGEPYFLFGFFDREGYIPSLETLIFAGKNLYADDDGLYYFRYAMDVFSGERDAIEDEDAPMISTATLNGIYDLEGAIRALTACKGRRSRQATE